MLHQQIWKFQWFSFWNCQHFFNEHDVSKICFVQRVNHSAQISPVMQTCLCVTSTQSDGILLPSNGISRCISWHSLVIMTQVHCEMVCWNSQICWCKIEIGPRLEMGFYGYTSVWNRWKNKIRHNLTFSEVIWTQTHLHRPQNVEVCWWTFGTHLNIIIEIESS